MRTAPAVVPCDFPAHADSLRADLSAPGELAVVFNETAARWAAGWRVYPCPRPRCIRWCWRRPPEDDDGDPTGGR